MDPFGSSLLLIAALLICIMLRIPIAFSFFIVSAPALYILEGPAGFTVLSDTTWKVATGYYLISIPLFILLAEVMEYSMVTKDLFVFMRACMARLPGGLLVASIWACAGFGAVSGVSVAAAATVSKIVIPELTKLKYDKPLLSGTLAAGGTLAILIPPSVPMVIFALLTDESVGRLFAAGILPAVLISTLFTALIIFRVYRNPNLAPEASSVSKEEIMRALPGLCVFLLIVLVVLGGLFSGLCNINESAALGVVVAIIAGLVFKRLTLRDAARSFVSGAGTTSFILLIVIGASIFAFLLTVLQFPQTVAESVLSAGLSQTTVVIAFMVVGLMLGLFIDAISILVLTIPIFLPIMQSMSIDPVWLCVLLVINLEAGLITPPVGLNLYIIQGVGSSFGLQESDIIKGIGPFLLLMAFAVATLIMFPSIVTMVPNYIFGSP
jgi:tripartite ATP-independent transporter DctM subunit